MDPYLRGPDWMPITPKTGSLFHADSQPRPSRSSWAMLTCFGPRQSMFINTTGFRAG